MPNVYSMEFADSAKEYGIENILTIGGRKPNGRQDARTIFVRVVTEAGSETFTDEFMNVAFSDDNSLFSCKAQPATNADAVPAEIRATGNGLTTLNAELKIITNTSARTSARKSDFARSKTAETSAITRN